LAKSNNKSLSQQSLSGALWMFSSSGAQAILRIVFSSVLARLLTPSDFGIVTIATMITGITEMFVQMGIGPAIVQSQNITDDHINSGFTFSILTGLGITFIFLLVNPLIASFFEMPELTNILNILVWIFPLKMSSRVSYSLIQRKLQFKKLAGLDMVSYLIGFGAIGITLAYNGYGFSSLIWATLAQVAINSILLFLVKPHSLKLRLNIALIKPLLSTGKHYTLASIFNYLAMQVDYFLVGKLMGPAQLGFYNRAYSLMNTSNQLVGNVMDSILFAGFSKLQNDSSRKTSSLFKSYSLLFMTFLPATIIIILLAPELILILLGPKWSQTILPFQILTIGMIFRIGYKIGSSFAKGNGAAKDNAINQVFYFSLVGIAAYLGILQGSIVYVAIYVDIALFITFVLSVRLAIKLSDFSWTFFLKSIKDGLILLILFGILNSIFVLAIRDIGSTVVLTVILTMILNLLFSLVFLKWIKSHTKEETFATLKSSYNTFIQRKSKKQTKTIV